MASQILNNILSSIFDSNEPDWNPSDKIPIVLKYKEQLKNDMRTFLSNSNYDVEAILDESKELYNESKTLVEEIEVCKDEIESETMASILKSVETHQVLTKELESVNFALDIVTDIVQCGTYIQDFEEGRKAQSYSRAMEAVYDLVQYMETSVEGFNEMDMYSNIKKTSQSILDNLLQELNQEWHKMITWNVKPGPRKSVLSFTLQGEESTDMVDILTALDKSQQLTEKVSELAQFLLVDVFTTIIQNDITLVAENDTSIMITINHKQSDRPQFEKVIFSLRSVFCVLISKLCVEFDRQNTIMKMIGKQICSDFREVMVKDCLVHTIPHNLNDLQSYDKITSEIQEFQGVLIGCNFFPNERFSMLEYLNDIDVLFAKNSSQHFLETARSIMLKDLSSTMSIGVESIPASSSKATPVLDDGLEEALKVLNKTIPNSLFYFPRCMISKTAQELLDLVYTMMEQAVQCSDVVCRKLYNTTRLVFELYDAVVPYHHENYLQTIPQYVALFHNNCMYLAHNLLTLGDKWLVLMEGREVDYPISFVDLVQKLRDLGCRHLTLHMQQQRKQILDNIRSSDLNSIVVKDVLSDNAEAAIRQCLRQLQLLKNVWIGVFPANVFCRLMATLVNMFVEELIHRVCTVEDISMEMATQLTEMYTLVMQKAPQLFQISSDIESHVKSWTKLQELIFVLGGSLKDIEKQWGEGTGPLAVHFTVEELRSLIKALFQNSQFRANLLSKIK